MAVTIALAGNPNSGKTTLFNALTGANQFVGNWPGVTVEKKEGKLKGYQDVNITDLPGIYSLSPYTLEEVVARNYLLNDHPDVIIDIVDGTNLERNLYLATQLIETGIPVILAVNMMDLVEKSGDVINIEKLKDALGCEVYEISALKGTGIKETADAAVRAGRNKPETKIVHKFDKKIEDALNSIEDRLGDRVPDSQKRYFAVKVFERDSKIGEELSDIPDAEDIIAPVEEEMDDDSESIITNERYAYIGRIIDGCLKKQGKTEDTVSDKIDRIVTNRWLALPIFAVVMFVVYFVSVTTVGSIATDWANDGVFGDGWYLLGIGRGAYEDDMGDFDVQQTMIDAYLDAAEEAGIDIDEISDTLEEEEPDEGIISEFVGAAGAAGIVTEAEIHDDEGEIEDVVTVGIADFEEALAAEEPDPADYGPWIPGIPPLLENLLDSIGCNDVLTGLILDGIVAGVGAVLGFVPQMLILFLFLAFLESCGYMSRVAFIMDRIFRRFGLSGKSFIPFLISSGCGVPGIMSTRTIENERDRRMTIMTTTFIPCGAKLPIIALFAGAIFGGKAWVAPSAYFMGIAAVICSGIILKKTKIFEGDPAPFVMELPAYHMPTVLNVLRSMWERGWAFIKKAGTVILLSTIFVWFTTFFGWVDGEFRMLEATEINHSILANIGNAIAWIFRPLGWGDWKATVAAITGLVAKENVVGTFGILYGFEEVAENGWEVWDNVRAAFTNVTAYSYMAFNLLCIPCFAALGAMRREMNSAKWFWGTIAFQLILAYAVALVITHIGNLIVYGTFGVGTVAAIVIVAIFLYLLLRPAKKTKTAKT